MQGIDSLTEVHPKFGGGNKVVGDIFHVFKKQIFLVPKIRTID